MVSKKPTHRWYLFKGKHTYLIHVYGDTVNTTTWQVVVAEGDVGAATTISHTSYGGPNLAVRAALKAVTDLLDDGYHLAFGAPPSSERIVSMVRRNAAWNF